MSKAVQQLFLISYLRISCNIFNHIQIHPLPHCLSNQISLPIQLCPLQNYIKTKQYDKNSNLCYLHVLGCFTIHWRVGDSQRTHPEEKLSLTRPRCYQLPVSPHLKERLHAHRSSPSWAIVCLGLCRSYEFCHSCCELICAASLFYLENHFPNIHSSPLALIIFLPLSSVMIPEPWEEES